MTSRLPRQRVAAIIQARTGSSRLPRKVLADISGRPLLSFLVERLSKSEALDEIILATTDKAEDDVLEALGRSLGISVVRGSEKDVLSRFVRASETTSAGVFLRITGDCPLIDPYLVSNAIEKFFSDDVDYLCNFTPPSYPDGLDLEVFSRECLISAHKYCSSADLREHVTPWMREQIHLKKATLECEQDLSLMRLTVDEPEDLVVIRSIVSHFQGSSSFTWKDIVQLYLDEPSIFIGNSIFSRNEGSILSSSQKLWRRAKRVIPGGNMLLSKRPEMFLPDLWPTYFSRCSGCRVWDLDGRELIDLSIMGIGTNILGYGHPEVDSAVLDSVHLGNMSTLNCPEEVLLAERLVSIHPWSDMARFARSGGEANAIAIRIARAATGRETVAICGYHGWHDWYLATNLSNDSGLEEHLLPGLEPNGVPKSLSGTVQPFSFNNIEQLEALIQQHNLAAVKMEVQRSVAPKPGFLEAVRSLCTANGIVLIFDECTSGFRENFGGLHLKYGVNPDMAMFGKALGNGYAITAVIGIRSVMEHAQSTFISSTFWTERIGPCAALKTLQVMETMASWDTITSIGINLRDRWNHLALSHGLNISFNGLPSLSNFKINSTFAMEYKTLIAQEMLRKGFLASTTCYTSIAHTSDIIDLYFEALDPIFALISECEHGRNVYDLLSGPVCHDGFRRLN